MRYTPAQVKAIWDGLSQPWDDRYTGEQLVQVKRLRAGLRLLRRQPLLPRKTYVPRSPVFKLPGEW